MDKVRTSFLALAFLLPALFTYEQVATNHYLLECKSTVSQMQPERSLDEINMICSIKDNSHGNYHQQRRDAYAN